LWIKKEKGLLKAGHIPREMRDAFEKDAENEVERRRNMAKVYAAMETSGISSVAKYKYWSDMAQSKLAKLRNDEERKKVKGLAQEFATEQRRFNEAYEQFSQKEQELREQQQSLQTLQMISRIGNVVSSAIKTGELASSNQNKPSVSAPSTSSQDASKLMIEYHERRIHSLTGDIYEWGQKLELRGESLKQINERLVNTFQSNGIQTDPKLVLPSKP
jgi:hypothetical protein